MSFRVPFDATDADLTDAIGQLAGVMTCTHRQLLQVIVAYDDRCAYRQDGSRNMAEWLSARLSISYTTANAWVRVARRLRHLPALAAAYEEGRLSYEQVLVVLRMATEGTDAEWAERAPGHSVAELEALALRQRDARLDEQAAHEKRRLWWRESDDHTRLFGGFDLPALAGERVKKTLTAIADAIPADPATDKREPFEARCADALELLCSNDQGTKRADRATVVIHADASFAAGGEGSAEVEEGVTISRGALERLLCDCDLEPIVIQPDGSLGIGRKTRSVPRAMERRIRRRDHGCRFPGCGLARWTQIHHMAHWSADRGPTNESNLITVCLYHHHFLHEEHWKARGDPNGVLEFVNRFGRVLKTGPPPLRPGLFHAA
ncbi:MAG: hypothetical protein QOE35_1606 [Actinomycetota bacterium]